MPSLLQTAIGLLLGAGMLGAGGLSVVGMVLFAFGNVLRGQQFMGAGARIAVVTFICGATYNVMKSGGHIPASVVGWILGIVLIVLSMQQFAKWRRNRQ